MNTLLSKKEHIFDVKNKVLTNSCNIYSHVRINPNICNNSTVSIVMTSSNRSAQVYFTLQTISQSLYKNVQVILVDDSTHDPVQIERLNTYPFTLDFIRINRAAKCWHNPLVNYNIGFKYVEGGKVIIQNAEVCHVGDVILHVHTHLPENTWSAYDVRATSDYAANDAIYKNSHLTLDILKENYFNNWYQGRTNNRSFHFLAAMDRTAFAKVGGFSYDCTFGSAYDDDDFILRIRSLGIHITPMHHEDVGCCGIHLFHGWDAGWNRGVEDNKGLFLNKLNYYNHHGVYIDVSESIDTFNAKYALLNT